VDLEEQAVYPVLLEHFLFQGLGEAWEVTLQPVPCSKSAGMAATVERAITEEVVEAVGNRFSAMPRETQVSEVSDQTKMGKMLLRQR
jgi:hypothetical protein